MTIRLIVRFRRLNPDIDAVRTPGGYGFTDWGALRVTVRPWGVLRCWTTEPVFLEGKELLAFKVRSDHGLDRVPIFLEEEDEP